MSRRKYTEDQLRLAVKNSTSIQGVLYALGIGYRSGEAWRMIKSYLIRYGIETAHFNPTRKGVPSNLKKHWKLILVFNPNAAYRERASYLKRALLEAGVPYVCECGQGDMWVGKKLTLTIDHRNGDWRNNRKSNLRFLCPNCHSQTPTFSSRKRGMARLEKRSA